MIEVRSSLSKRLMASSRDLYRAAETLWVMSLFRSMERPRSWNITGQYDTQQRRRESRLVRILVCMVSTNLNVALLQQCLIAVGGRPGDVCSLILTVGSQTFVEQEAETFKHKETSQVFVSCAKLHSLSFLHWSKWGNLGETKRTAQPQRLLGQDQRCLVLSDCFPLYFSFYVLFFLLLRGSCKKGVKLNLMKQVKVLLSFVLSLFMFWEAWGTGE